MTRDDLESPLAWIRVQGKFLADGDCKAHETVGSAVYEVAGGWRVGFVGFRTDWRLRPVGPGGPGAAARLSLVPG
jgi:hypothetical protein